MVECCGGEISHPVGAFSGVIKIEPQIIFNQAFVQNPIWGSFCGTIYLRD
jgi:hypothetical protein